MLWSSRRVVAILVAVVGLSLLCTASSVAQRRTSSSRLRGPTTTTSTTTTAIRKLQDNSNINNPNPPTARDDEVDTPLNTIVLIVVLENDFDQDGDPMTIVSATNPSHGQAVINTVGENQNTITYTPDTDFVGVDSFFYTITDNKGGFGVARVTVNVLPPPNTPPMAGDDVVDTEVNTAVVIPVLQNDVDVNPGDVLTITAVTRPANGVATIDAAAKTITYTPNTDFVGTDSFSYQVSDGRPGGIDTARVQVTVMATAVVTLPPSPAPPSPTTTTLQPTLAPTPPPTTPVLGLPRGECWPAFAQCRDQTNVATCFNQLGDFDMAGWYNRLHREVPFFACDLQIINMPDNNNNNNQDCSGGSIVGTVTGTAFYNATTLNARYYFTYNLTNDNDDNNPDNDNKDGNTNSVYSPWKIESIHVNADIFHPVPMTEDGEYSVDPDLYTQSRYYNPMERNATGSMRVRCPKDDNMGYVNTIFYARVCRTVTEIAE